MPETTSTGKKDRKRRVSWLEDSPGSGAQTSQKPRADERHLAPSDVGGSANGAPRDGAPSDSATRTVPRIPASGAAGGAAGASGASSSADLLGRLRANPAPLAFALFALLVLAGFLWFFVLRGGEESAPEASGEPSEAGGDPVVGAGRVPDDPFAGGEVRDTGVVFGAMQVEDGEANLSGAGLQWSGTVTEKEGTEGETITLEGPTAAQLERGFDLGAASVETGVYAVAQQSGEVLHVSTHTYLPEEEGAEAGELTLGTVHALTDGRHTGYAYYLDERREDSSQVTRTYVRPGQESYRVSYEAQPGTFVPLLIGWQGFGEEGSQQQQQGHSQNQREGE